MHKLILINDDRLSHTSRPSFLTGVELYKFLISDNPLPNKLKCNYPAPCQGDLCNLYFPSEMTSKNKMRDLKHLSETYADNIEQGTSHLFINAPDAVHMFFETRLTCGHYVRKSSTVMGNIINEKMCWSNIQMTQRQNKWEVVVVRKIKKSQSFHFFRKK